MSEDLQEAIDALEGMFIQYCGTRETTKDGKPMFDHDCMGAGEEASDVLLKHGRIELSQLVRL
jgi:hypothetical protein